ncbi:MAG: hypothetical protein HDR48_03715 [Bacteroides sp.]|nr:hypothetical protein [Bacteroides sp.]
MTKTIESSMRQVNFGGMVFTTICLMVLASFTFLYACACDPKRSASESAETALLATAVNPDDVKIIAVSKPDSIFNHEFLSTNDKQKISSILMAINDKVMSVTNNLESIEKLDDNVNDLMFRQMSAMSVLRSMDAPMIEQPTVNTRKFTGWRVKIEYEGIGAYGNKIHSEYWALLDKTGHHVINSFEIPLL